MRAAIVVFLLVSFLAIPVGTACAEPLCDWAPESGKVIDWAICVGIAWVVRLAEMGQNGGMMVYW